MTQAKGYVDPQYLQLLAELLQAHKQRTYELLRLQPGARVLDVGCGPGTDTLPLAARVGPGGRVAGVDWDAAMLTEGDRRAAQAGVAGRVQHVRADAAALPWPDHTFDACRCERLFQHLPDPVPALAEMVRVTRPGGWVVVLDTDYGTTSCDTTEPDIERRLAPLFVDHVHNGYSGRRLYGMFRRQGLADVVAEPHAVHYTSYALFRHIGRLDAIEQLALAAGVVTPMEIARWQRSLEEADAAGACYGHIVTVIVAGRKP